MLFIITTTTKAGPPVWLQRGSEWQQLLQDCTLAKKTLARVIVETLAPESNKKVLQRVNYVKKE